MLIQDIAIAASFDCNKARSFAEKTICSNKKLGDLDLRLAGIYKEGLAEMPSLREEQRAWLRTLRECKDEVCLIEKYEERIDDLVKFFQEFYRQQNLQRSESQVEQTLRYQEGGLNYEYVGQIKNDRPSGNGTLKVFRGKKLIQTDSGYFEDGGIKRGQRIFRGRVFDGEFKREFNSAYGVADDIPWNGAFTEKNGKKTQLKNGKSS